RADPAARHAGRARVALAELPVGSRPAGEMEVDELAPDVGRRVRFAHAEARRYLLREHARAHEVAGLDEHADVFRGRYGAGDTAVKRPGFRLIARDGWGILAVYGRFQDARRPL